MLKAMIAERTGEMPPRLHDLSRLAQEAGIEPDERQRVLMEDLSRYYIQSRYPAEIAALWRGLDETWGREVLAQTRDMLQWLTSMR